MGCQAKHAFEKSHMSECESRKLLAGGVNSSLSSSFNPSYASLIASLLGTNPGQIAVRSSGPFIVTQV